MGPTSQDLRAKLQSSSVRRMVDLGPRAEVSKVRTRSIGVNRWVGRLAGVPNIRRPSPAEAPEAAGKSACPSLTQPGIRG